MASPERPFARGTVKSAQTAANARKRRMIHFLEKFSLMPTGSSGLVVTIAGLSTSCDW
jgi:hypothetical protein